ncbi:MAG: carbohydrate-binding protein [Balneola sp.]|nr:carbohydrate-binding protein [Balneola sp.]MBO6650954.1 carbohydrate-binding protein [Balneola sp.]MBO6711896.1 carbohydrate-binding protein [Balneola sp.]MBO6800091.1 carbohydrate-binding protein [Balneola sp.]MBO6871528.1 carbohydrate-binding protein [Balneola sp.]
MKSIYTKIPASIKSFSSLSLGIFCVLSLLLSHKLSAQSVSVGAGSYSTSLPSGEIGPQNFSGQNIDPKISSSFNLPIQTNDYWSNLIYPFFNDPFSNVIYAHPLNVKAISDGLQIGYTSNHSFAANDYLFPFSHQLTVSVSGLSAPRTEADHYGDWTFTALWEDSDQSLRATLGHGLPYVFFNIEGGDAIVTPKLSSTIWYHQDEVLGITVEGKHYALFAPTGSVWSGNSTYQSSLNGKNYLSVALLPDTALSTLDLFRSRAYAFVTNSTIEWDYNETTSELISTYNYETVLKDSSESNLNETLTALYRHQWLYTNNPLTHHTYQSPRGIMKLKSGNSFTTEIKFSGILPTLPDIGDYNPDILQNLIKEVALEKLGSGPSYENGKAMGRFSHLVHIADQLGATTERDYFLSQLKLRLEDWFTIGGEQQYSYNSNWDVLTGYPSGYGADNQINDHHFHSSYAIMSAATIAQYDSAWASQENWGGMVNLLIKDANNWDRQDIMFPFLRSHDSYAGHSWAAGHGDFGDGNNQESSSESMNFAAAAFLWGQATQQQDIRDLGVFLHTTERTAVEQYWFDIDKEVFPQDYNHEAIGMVWGGKGVHSTWFGANPEFIHGINILPITSASLYLGRHPEYVLENYNEIVAERGGQPIIWKDILWEYLALADPDLALSYYYADENYEPFDGESRAHTLHWLYNLKKMGHVETEIFADIASYSVFKDARNNFTYIAYNPGDQNRVVHFTDGYSMIVAPKTLKTERTVAENPNAPVASIVANRTSGKAPLNIDFEGSRSFDRNDLELTYYWNFADQGSSSKEDTTFTFNEVGEYWIQLSVTNTLGLSSEDSVLITVLNKGTPFLQNPHQVPGRIEAEHYDNGGEGIAYHDVEASNIGLAFRPDEGVDLEASNDQGFDVYWIVAGEWIEYTFEVSETNTYDFTPYVSSVPGFGNFTLYIDNENVSGRKNVTGTGGWQNWTPIEITDVQLEKGIHTMRFEFDSDSDKTGWLFSLNYIQVTKSITTSIEHLEEAPDNFTLSQNYPNPFNPETQISYKLPQSGNVKLEVYSMLGQKVSTLVNKSQKAGTYTATFNGSSLASGIYFYQLKLNNQVIIKRMTLLK